MYLAKTPRYIKSIYKNLIWDIPNNEQKVYLTFDDGPTPEVTDFVLKTLNFYKVRATFFCLGKQVDNHQNIFKRIIENNHIVGNHTYNHVNGWLTNTKTYIEELALCNKAFESKLFRPPYGKVKAAQSKLINKTHKVIMWDVLSGDFDNKINPEQCFKNVINNVKTGSIIVFHDSSKAYKNLQYALPKSIAYLQQRGYVFDVIT